MRNRRFFLFLCYWLIIVSIQTTSQATAGSGGEVKFQVRTVPYGGKYSAKNIGAVWVEDAQGRFVKTIRVWANRRIQHLIKWRAISNENTVDAVTSATLRSHQTHNVTWNCTDITGSQVADGSYQIVVEFTEDNSNKGRPPGKWTAVEFTKSSSSLTLRPNDETYFKDIELIYTPGGTTQPTSLSGTVEDASSNQPLQNATVQLNRGNNIIYEITTDATGLYSFDNIEAGTYTLVVSKSGYTTWTEDVSLSSGQQVSGKNISLSKQGDSTAPSPPKNVRVEGSN
ncbi:MAG: DUF2271 domain-containing protein [bacterium]